MGGGDEIAGGGSCGMYGYRSPSRYPMYGGAPEELVGGTEAVEGGKRRATRWNKLVKSVMRSRGVSLKEALKIAKPMYRKSKSRR